MTNLNEPQADAIGVDCYAVGDRVRAVKDQWDWDTGATYIKANDLVEVVEVCNESLLVLVESRREFAIWKRDARREDLVCRGR